MFRADNTGFAEYRRSTYCFIFAQRATKTIFKHRDSVFTYQVDSLESQLSQLIQPQPTETQLADKQSSFGEQETLDTPEYNTCISAVTTVWTESLYPNTKTALMCSK